MNIKILLLDIILAFLTLAVAVGPLVATALALAYTNDPNHFILP